MVYWNGPHETESGYWNGNGANGMNWGLGTTVLEMLTIIAEVVHQDDLVDQFRRTSVQNTVMGNRWGGGKAGEG